MLQAPGIIVAPGAYDGFSARLIEAAGFPAVYMTGAGTAASHLGQPDLGLATLTEMANHAGHLASCVTLPVIADADTGYGNALSARRAVREFERAGVAALHLEDQTFPKRCGHYDDKSVVPVGEMVQKLRAARDAANDDLVLIARTDALAVEGLDAAIERGQAYAEAGADVIFVEAPTTEAEIEAVGRRLRHPLLINMFQGGKTPLVALDRLARWGYRIAIIPSDLQRAAIRAMEGVLAAIKRDGNSAAVIDRMATFQEREAIVDTPGLLALDRRFASD